ncbi:MAG: ComEC/Rec2 family competence protein [Turicibacter sp.]|nr:ComEC/Rec2 family competence protein [Turicibacter sp.]
MSQFLVEIDYLIELIEQAHWTDYVVFLLAYLILLLGLLGSVKKNRRYVWYNCLWVVVCPPIGIYLIKHNKKIKKKKRQALIRYSLTGWTIVLSAVLIYLGWIPRPEYHSVDAYESDQFATRPSGLNLEVHFIDIGQGDATLIVYDDFHILIDGGNNGTEEKLLDYLDKQQVDDIEILVATHPDADHIGGLAEVIDHYDVHLIIDSGESHSSQTYKNYYEAVKRQQARGAINLEDADFIFPLSEQITFEIIETGDDNGDRNNNSVVAKLSYSEIDFLFTGDMESKTEQKILDRQLEAEILKAGHHGSKTSSSNEFLDVVKPETVIISAGLNNSYGHPHRPLIDRLKHYTDDIYVTYEKGHIVVTTDGTDYSLDFR